jgi:hypothetical protein
MSDIQRAIEHNVGLVGGPHSGKTTYLTALEVYTQQYRTKTWTYEGVDKSAQDWLNNNQESLKRGEFPGATLKGTSTLEFLIHRRGVCITIKTVDRPGVDWIDAQDKVVEYLADCDAIMILIAAKTGGFNPINMVRNLIQHLDRMRNGGRVTGQPLPHRVSVCLSQYDDRDTFQFMKQNRYLAKGDNNGVSNTPYLEPHNVVRYIYQEIDEGDQILRLLALRFIPHQVNFYSISSIGFFMQPQSKAVDWENCDNVGNTPKGDCIRTGKYYRPVNLLNPIGWICSNQQSNWMGVYDQLSGSR